MKMIEKLVDSIERTLSEKFSMIEKQKFDYLDWLKMDNYKNWLYNKTTTDNDDYVITEDNYELLNKGEFLILIFFFFTFLVFLELNDCESIEIVDDDDDDGVLISNLIEIKNNDGISRVWNEMNSKPMEYWLKNYN
jgi:hypothetical protein